MKLELQKGSRTRTLAVIIAIIMAIFVVRLFYLQVIKHGDYVALARSQQVKETTIFPVRGELYAMEGATPTKLVLNEKVYVVFVDPTVLEEKDKALEVLKKVAGGEMLSTASEAMERKNSRYQVVARGVTTKQAELIRKEKVSGLGFQEQSRRVYPEGQLAAQTLGFVNAEGTAQYGVEQALDERLRGENGVRKSVTDVSNVPLSLGSDNVNIPPKNGDNLALSIDRNVQAYTERALKAGMDRVGADHGSVIVMNPQNGQIMAMANLPTYNPAEYNKVQDGGLFTNPIVSSPYEPGSVIKTFTTATGVDRGVIAPDSTYYNTDTIKVDDRTIGNATKGQLGTITMQHALDYSLNTGMVTVVQRLSGGSGDRITRQGRDVLYSYFHDRFGLGTRTGLEVVGEANGQVIDPGAVEGNAVRYSNMSFGQGLNVTMVQVAAGFSSIVNGGTYYKPTIVRGVVGSDGKLVEDKPVSVRSTVSAATSQTLRDMTQAARQKFYARNDRPGYMIGGKTGTSETIVNGQYTDKQTIATYLGYGGDNAPKYVIMIRISGEGLYLGGGEHASPIFTDISNWMIDYLKLQPKG